MATIVDAVDKVVGAGNCFVNVAHHHTDQSAKDRWADMARDNSQCVRACVRARVRACVSVCA